MNIADVKRELSGDEKVLENVFKLETLYKKYKFVIWAILIGAILFFVGKSIMEEMQESKLAEANKAFLTLQTKADDAEALAVLKEKNPELFELFSFSQANKNKDVKALESLTNSTNVVISDASAYAVATLQNKKSDSKLYNEMAILNEAYTDIKAGDTKSANEKLQLIDEQSRLYSFASLLKHAMLKAK